MPALRLSTRIASDKAAMTRELGEQVRAAIDQLPEPYRVVVLLRDVEELPMNEVMEATGLSEPG